VLANRRLRVRLAEEAGSRGVKVCIPEPVLCTDNAAMIGAAASHWLERGVLSDWTATVDPGRQLA
jgi:N6-L-threonylcarbamoyladenine synthase